MILDIIENAHLYYNISKNVARCVKILNDKNILNQPDGKYEIDGEKLYYLVVRYTTKPVYAGELEAHRKYIDLQFVISGEETIPYANTSTLKISQRYSKKVEATMYQIPKAFSKLRLYKGVFCIFFPQDAHLPGRISQKKSHIHKIVFKIAI